MQLNVFSSQNAVTVAFASSPTLTTSRQRSHYSAILLFAAALFLSATGRLSAAQKSDLEISLVTQRVEFSAGKTVLTPDPAVSASPGEVIQYTASYRNLSSKSLSQLAPTLPIPVGTEYVADSAAPAATEGSLDGKSFERLPIRRPQKLADGSEIYVVMPNRCIRALRWSAGDLPAAGTFIASARVRVISNPSNLAQE